MRASRCPILLFFAATAPCQWTADLLLPGPAGITGAAGAYDTLRDQVLVFGGDRNGRTDQFWRLDGERWVALQPPARPSPRTDARMVSMVLSGRVMLYGGSPGSFQQELDETWEYDGITWTLRATTQSPGGRAGHAMAYDLARDRVVLFGGVQGVFVARDDTWEWNGSNWLPVPTTASPSARHQASAAYDMRRGHVVLFGGSSIGGQLDGTTWTFDGTDWTALAPATSPPPRARATMVFDWSDGHCRLVGGSNGAPLDAHQDSWEFDGSTWTPTPGPPPPGRMSAVMVYDPSRDRTVLVGGARAFAVLDRTWTFGARSVALGAGCPGSAGTPTLMATAPRLGGTTAVALQNLLPSAPMAGLALGERGVDVDLGPFGLTGCRLHGALDQFVLLPAASGIASASLPVPADPRLLGATAWLTGASFDAASPLGAVPTGSVRLVVGTP
ncbi:MAG: kelch repeat-containing protein [Planctomycetota bacterium]